MEGKSESSGGVGLKTAQSPTAPISGSMPCPHPTLLCSRKPAPDIKLSNRSQLSPSMPAGFRGDSCSKLVLTHSVTGLPCSGKMQFNEVQWQGWSRWGSSEEVGPVWGPAASLVCRTGSHLQTLARSACTLSLTSPPTRALGNDSINLLCEGLHLPRLPILKAYGPDSWEGLPAV